MSAQFQTLYPTANLISELLQIYAGKFVVRAEIQVDGITRATGLAAAETLELAEDRARSRALMVLLPDASSSVQPEIFAQYPTVMSEVQPVLKPSLPSDRVDKKQPSSFATTSEWNSSSYSDFSPVPTPKESALTPVEPHLLTVDNKVNLASATPWTHAEVTGEPNDRMYDLQPESGSELMIPFGDEEPADSSDYSYEENAELEPQVVAEVKKPVNMSECFAQTTTELKRLDWSSQQGRGYLKEAYGKTSRQQLTDDELLEFLEYLKSQPTPNRLLLE